MLTGSTQKLRERGKEDGKKKERKVRMKGWGEEGKTPMKKSTEGMQLPSLGSSFKMG